MQLEVFTIYMGILLYVGLSFLSNISGSSNIVLNFGDVLHFELQQVFQKFMSPTKVSIVTLLMDYLHNI